MKSKKLGFWGHPVLTKRPEHFMVWSRSWICITATFIIISDVSGAVKAPVGRVETTSDKAEKSFQIADGPAASSRASEVKCYFHYYYSVLVLFSAIIRFVEKCSGLIDQICVFEMENIDKKNNARNVSSKITWSVWMAALRTESFG